ncbi:MAG TPA: calcium-binding protein [Solirubrobacterales bacterium]|nr:calcium-binding protein [Solirubrobacterales bacterium]
METMTTFLRHKNAARLILSPAPFALAFAAWLAFAVPGASGGDPTCHGKPATIVSNAAVIRGGKAPDVIVAGPGNNTIYGEGGNDLICGGAGNDTIDGERGVDEIYGEEGDDTIEGERGSDKLDGGPGNDKILGGRGSDEIEGGPGTDLVEGEQGNDHVDGGEGDGDIVEGNQGDDTLDGGAGNEDVIIGSTGNDKIDGGPGEHDIADYQGTGGAVTINLQTQTVTGAENEHLEGIEDAIGGSGNDTLIGSSEANRLDGGPGDDHLEATGGGDAAFGGPGSDQCTGGFAQETSCGPAAGSDGLATEIYESIDGQSTLILTGTSGPDQGTVNYSGGKFTISGSDVTNGDPTNPDCSGTSGTIVCSGKVTAIEATLGAGNDELTIGQSVPHSIGSTLEGGTGSDKLVGGPGNDVLYAGEDSDPDTLEGGGGNDVLYGVNIFHPKKDSGAATMNGGPGSDLMIGGQPCDGDTFNGGAGPNDSASFARVHNSGSVAVEATIGGSVITPGVGGCTPGKITSSTEKIEGSPGNDILDGDNKNNTLLGRGGNDKLDGKGGFDDCVGGGGHDTATNCEKKASIP